MIPLQSLLQQCKARLVAHYGSHFKGLVLYGSCARNEAGPNSDIDLLILLDSPPKYSEEIRCIIDLLYPLQLECEHLISAKPVFFNEFEVGSIQLYRNAKEEGVRVE
uniref:Nucleotidyltransferase domain-containing protein n=1 Tax=Candidatus Kentrum sp. MB TaxID=2138164 RepID=A0A451BGW0_9GAMM|nr:MAG: Nucleotidyltransferase domain-containing protein [Candidatus Kentron sp. MB]VFK35857.1 MAG: Nucleotidyltransferase domain-containing protein [Candidatus Kentron sp. MB]VFK77512.1 MAG: Nucleotidyltransferase domain-containing protein [Candidatus Kentron sp. MB]